MHDRGGTMNTTPDPDLAAALRALPEIAPQPDPWPDLARSLQGRRRAPRARHLVPAALAAGLALAVLWPQATLRQRVPDTAPAVASEASAPMDEIDDLHRRSQALESWITALAANAPQDSRDLMAAVEVEDLIGLVDLQLGAARNRADALPLWRQRVDLLEDLASIRMGGFAIAAHDAAAFEANASSNRIN
jgi:hypothetical protein